MKPIVLPATTAIVLGAVVAATSIFGRRPASKDAGPTSPASTASLEEEVGRLRRDVSAVKAKAEASERRTSAQAAASETPSSAGRKPLSREEKREQSRAAREAWYRAVDSQFDRERPDPEWSSDATRNVRAMVANHAEHGTLVSADCAATMCKVVVSHDSAEMQKEFSTEITEEPLLDAEVMYKYDADARSFATTMWVSRAGQRLPRVRR